MMNGYRSNYKSLDTSDIEGARPRKIYHKREKLGDVGASIVDNTAMDAAGIKLRQMQANKQGISDIWALS